MKTGKNIYLHPYHLQTNTEMEKNDNNNSDNNEIINK